MKCKILFLSIVIVALLFFPKTNLGAAVGFGIRYATLGYKVNNMPSDFRLVPIHSDDGYTSPEKNGHIEQTKYTRNGWLSLEVELHQEKEQIKNLHWGISFVWIMHAMSDNVALRNYTNAPGTETRGYGAALTFATTGIQGLLPKISDDNSINFLFNWTPKIFVDYYLNEKDLFNKFRLSLSYHKFTAINGWDRYDHYEFNDIKTLAHIYPLSAELNIWKYYAIGITYNLFKTTGFGKTADTKINKLSYSFSIIIPLG